MPATGWCAGACASLSSEDDPDLFRLCFTFSCSTCCVVLIHSRQLAQVHLGTASAHGITRLAAAALGIWVVRRRRPVFSSTARHLDRNPRSQDDQACSVRVPVRQERRASNSAGGDRLTCTDYQSDDLSKTVDSITELHQRGAVRQWFLNPLSSLQGLGNGLLQVHPMDFPAPREAHAHAKASGRPRLKRFRTSPASTRTQWHVTAIREGW